MKILKAYLKTRSAKKLEQKSQWTNYLIICECNPVHRSGNLHDILQMTSGTKYFLIVNNIYMGQTDLLIENDYGYPKMDGTVAEFDDLFTLIQAFNNSDLSGHEPIPGRQDYYYCYTYSNPWEASGWDTTRPYYCSKNYTINGTTGSAFTYAQNPLSGMRPKEA